MAMRQSHLNYAERALRGACRPVPKGRNRRYPSSVRTHRKYPRLVWIADELPKGATGKILKREIVPPTGPDLKLAELPALSPKSGHATKEDNR